MDDKLHILNTLSKLRVKKQEEKRIENQNRFLFFLFCGFTGFFGGGSSYIAASISLTLGIIAFNIFTKAKQEKLNINKDIKNLEERLYKENHDPS